MCQYHTSYQYPPICLLKAWRMGIKSPLEVSCIVCTANKKACTSLEDIRWFFGEQESSHCGQLVPAVAQGLLA